MVNGKIRADDPFQVLLHLSGVHLHVQEGLGRTAQPAEGLLGKGPESDRADQTDFHPLGTGRLNGVQGRPGPTAEGDHHQIGPLHLHFLPPLLFLFDLPVFFHQVQVELDETGIIERRGIDHFPLPVSFSPQGPGLFRDRKGFHQVEIHRLHHLAQHSIHKNDDRVSVEIGQVKCQVGMFGHFLSGRGTQDDDMIIAVPPAFGHLPVIRLRRGDPAQTGARPGDVHDDAGELPGGQRGQAFRHQAHSRAGGRSHRPHPRASRSPDHVDPRDFAFALQEGAFGLRHPLGHVLEEFILRGNGIAGVKPASGADGPLGNRLIPAHEFYCHSNLQEGQVQGAREKVQGKRKNKTFILEP